MLRGVPPISCGRSPSTSKPIAYEIHTGQDLETDFMAYGFRSSVNNFNK
jgi:hypothetical protein